MARKALRSDSPGSRRSQETLVSNSGANTLSPEVGPTPALERPRAVLTVDIRVEAVEEIVIEECLEQVHLREKRSSSGDHAAMLCPNKQFTSAHVIRVELTTNLYSSNPSTQEVEVGRSL